MASYEASPDRDAVLERDERRELIREYREMQRERSARFQQMRADKALDLYGRGWVRATTDSDDMSYLEGSVGLTPDGVRVLDNDSGSRLVATFQAITSVSVTSASDSLVAAHPYVFENGDPCIVEVLMNDGGEAIVHPAHPSHAEHWARHIERWSP